ncbi:glutathione S-transferase N-terminal domain-containing protein [candidate division WOR-3 bacterium]|nr:glutathione S-transferase N-terminal domain-containing protein [candidate division WOR-3 bacterium]
MSKIIVYSTPTCPYCNLVKDYLKQKGVEFEEKDVSKNRVAAREMVERSGEMGVPQIDINGTIIVGFNRDAIDGELGKIK